MTSTPGEDLRFLHALRVRGHASIQQLAARLGLPVSFVEDDVLDREARGWVTRTAFGDDESWSLTDRGKVYGESLLAAELDDRDARGVVEEVYECFLPLNDQVAAACSGYQLTELGLGDATADSTIDRLREPAHQLVGLEARLAARLPRFRGYASRFTTALALAEGDPAWITAMDRDSCHRTWFELHEDLIATLGRHRS